MAGYGTTRGANGWAHPAVRPDSHVTAEMAAAFEASGRWAPRVLFSLLAATANAMPDRVAGVTCDAAGVSVERVTYDDLRLRADSFAYRLRAAGVERGDVVAVSMENGTDYTATIFAILRLGAVYTGIPVAYGARESLAILGGSGAKAIVTSASHRSIDLVERYRGVRNDLPDLAALIVDGAPHGGIDADRGEFDLRAAVGEEHPLPNADWDPGSVCQIGFTSGTTGEPKGVMNTHQTLQAVLEPWIDHVGAACLGNPCVNLIASPMGHHTGFLWGSLLTTLMGGTAVYLPRWMPAAALSVIEREGITLMFGAPTFLLDLMHEVTEAGAGPSLPTYVMAGAPVPRALPGLAGRVLGCTVLPAWGMTEYGIGVSCAPSMPPEAFLTDGAPVPGCEVRIEQRDDPGPSFGGAGELQIRGPGLFVGYLGRPDTTAAAFTGDGWFRTGDVAVLQEGGWVELVGREKDMVIRGGENIPIHIIETLLFQHPDIVDAAVVGLPDERLGETCCAVLVTGTDIGLTLDEVRSFLLQQGLSTHYLPEHLDLVAELPKTPSGKVRKVQIRQDLTQRAPTASRRGGA